MYLCRLLFFYLSACETSDLEHSTSYKEWGIYIHTDDACSGAMNTYTCLYLNESELYTWYWI